jgi:GDP-mannose 6-dehydrogenase
MKKIAVFGMGYVGCVTAACLSRDGHRVIGVDISMEKVQALRSGHSPVVEPGLEPLVREQVASGRLEATNDIDSAVLDSEMALVAVGTPSEADGSVETHAVERVVQAIGRLLRHTDQPYTIVVRSTLLPGILEERLTPLLVEASGEQLGERIRLAIHPEFLRETTAIRDYDDPPFLLAGSDEDEVADAIFKLYPHVAAKRIHTDTRTAALVKYACNAFHALKVSFANEIGVLAHTLGADGHEVMRVVCEDNRLNISPAYLRPGFAFGGSCLPKDVRALTRFAQRNAIDVELLASILRSNDAHIERALQRVRDAGHRRIGLVGLSFKAGTDDLRESPQVRLAESLLGQGYDLKIYDPDVRLADLTGRNLSFIDQHLPHLASLLVDDPRDLYEHSDLLILATGVATHIDWQNEYFRDVLDLQRDLTSAPTAVVPTT